MFMMTAAKAVTMFDKNGNPTESAVTLLDSIRSSRTSNLANADAGLSDPELVEACEYARDVCGVDFTSAQLAAILELYPVERADLARHTLRDTLARESFVSVIAHFLVGASWPAYGDNVDLTEFQALLEHQARKLGYKLTPPSA